MTLSASRAAPAVGAAWAAFSVLSEFGFGHDLEGDSRAHRFRTYDVTAANLRILIPLSIAGGPLTVRAIATTPSV